MKTALATAGVLCGLRVIVYGTTEHWYGVLRERVAQLRRFTQRGLIERVDFMVLYWEAWQMPWYVRLDNLLRRLHI